MNSADENNYGVTLNARNENSEWRPTIESDHEFVARLLLAAKDLIVESHYYSVLLSSLERLFATKANHLLD